MAYGKAFCVALALTAAQLALGEAVPAAEPDLQFDRLLQQADADNAQAQFLLGLIELTQRRNPPAAAEWFERAAGRGHDGARMTLAVLLFDGRGVPPDPARAVDLLQAAAANGRPEAATMLRRAAEAGYPPAGAWMAGLQE